MMSHTAIETAIRAMTAGDGEAAARVAFEAHGDISARLGVPSEHPSLEFSRGVMGAKLSDPYATGWVADRNGRVLGSVFLNDFGSVAAIGPLTVHPTEGPGAGRALLESVLAEAEARGQSNVRLVQSPAHLRSLALYIKMGFEVREPLVLLQGAFATEGSPQGTVRPAMEADANRCRDFAEQILGVAREREVQDAITRGTATVCERGGDLIAYATGIGLRGHAVAVSDEALLTVLARSPRLPGPGFLAPVRNAALIRSALAAGMRFAWSATLMTRGHYVQPRGAFIPSIAF
jgi:ribosomal protein S18 acetylase RimI-like enzyme